MEGSTEALKRDLVVVIAAVNSNRISHETGLAILDHIHWSADDDNFRRYIADNLTFVSEYPKGHVSGSPGSPNLPHSGS